MASGLVSSLLSSASKLLDLLRSPPAASTPLRGGKSAVAADVQRLQRLLRRIQATLDDAGEREVRDSSVKLWIEELTDLARDAEDVLDDYRYKLLRRQAQEDHQTAAAVFADFTSTSLGKRTHDGDEARGTCESQRIRKITRRLDISSDRAVLQLRPEDDGDTSKQIVVFTQRFEDISTDQANLRLGTEDDDDCISERIREIRCQFEEVSRDRAALQLRPEDGERIIGRDYQWQSRATSHLLDTSCIFGRTKEKEHIIKSVMYYKQCLLGINILPIVGMGGIGKTTIAQMVYNDSRVQESYDHMSWVHVSQTFDSRRLQIAIIESCTSRPCVYSESELSVVHDALKQEIRSKSVFLVLDDLWIEHQICWQDFLGPLKYAETVTILVTTRSKEVAHLVQTDHPFVLGLLPEDNCWQLFQCYAFHGTSISKESSLIQVGRNIMDKCSGLPLAIKSIGCLLRSKMDMQTWMEISESEFWEHSDDSEEMFSALRLSFYQLPARLKPCFLLCSLYPKGQPFTKDGMIHLWIAHGYIHPKRGKTPEEVAGEYFDELNERSLIDTCSNHGNARQFPKRPDAKSTTEIISDQLFNTIQDYDDLHIRALIQSFRERKTKASSEQSPLSIQWFQLHDMIWDLAKSLSDYVLALTSGDEWNVENKVQHLFIWLEKRKFYPGVNSQWDHSMDMNISNSQFTYNEMYDSPRTITSRMSIVNRLRSSSSDATQDFTNLVWRMESLLAEGRRRIPTIGNQVPQVKKKICQLKLHQMNYLRTLVLKSWTCYHIGINKLTYLRALVLDSCTDSAYIFAIQYLKHLRYLHVTNCDSLIGQNKEFENSICHLYSLEKLIISTCRKEFSIQSCKLFSLRYLHLSVRFFDWSFHPFSQFYNLETLCLQSCDSIAELPLCIGYLMKLRRLQLAQIPKITILNHYSFPCQKCENESKFRAVIFPSLEELELDGLCDLLYLWELEDSDYPKMQRVTIKNCYKLRRVPYFGSVRNLEIWNLSLTCLQLSACNEPSQLLSLDIRDCPNLKSLYGLKNIRCLGSLYIAHCPELIVFHKERLPCRPQHVFIDDCPGLKKWCDEQEFYYQIPKMMRISEVKRAKVNGVAYFKSIEHMSLDICPEKGPELILSPDNWLPSELRLLKFGFGSPCGVPSSHGALCTLRKLEIRGCPKLVALMDFEELNFLHSLTIADCPLLYILPEMKFPPLLTSLVVEGCHKLLSLQLNISDPSLFTEIEISDCQGLMNIGRLKYLSNLESLVLLHCPLLQLNELLPSIPEFVIIFHCPKLKNWCKVQSIKYQVN